MHIRSEVSFYNKSWPLGVNFAPRDELVCPLGVNLSPGVNMSPGVNFFLRDELFPQG
jgi:hypothetical protein